MSRYLALLRAVNVGVTGKLPMADLRESLAAAGYEDVVTVLASGNVVLAAATPSTGDLERSLETHLAEAHGLETDVMVRSAGEWAQLVTDNPMPQEADAKPSQFVALVTKDTPDRTALAAYLDGYQGPERVEAGPSCLYIHYPEGQGRSKLRLPAAVGVGTARNWNTVRKLAKLLAD